MMKRIGLGLCFLLASVLAAEDYKEERFSLSYPDGWKVIQHENLTVFAPLKDYKENTPRVMVKIEKVSLKSKGNPKEELLKTYVPQVLQTYYLELRTKQIQKSPNTSTVDSSKVAEMIARLKGKSAKKEKQIPQAAQTKEEEKKIEDQAEKPKGEEKNSDENKPQLPKEIAKQIADSEKSLAEVKKLEEAMKTKPEEQKRRAEERRKRIAEENKRVKVKPVREERFMGGPGYKLEIEFTPDVETIEKIVHVGLHQSWLITLTISYPQDQKLPAGMVTSIVQSFTCSL